MISFTPIRTLLFQNWIWDNVTRHRIGYRRSSQNYSGMLSECTIRSKERIQDRTGQVMGWDGCDFLTLMMDLLLALFMMSFSSEPRTGNGYRYDDMANMS